MCEIVALIFFFKVLRGGKLFRMVVGIYGGRGPRLLGTTSAVKKLQQAIFKNRRNFCHADARFRRAVPTQVCGSQSDEPSANQTNHLLQDHRRSQDGDSFCFKSWPENLEPSSAARTQIFRGNLSLPDSGWPRFVCMFDFSVT